MIPTQTRRNVNCSFVRLAQSPASRFSRSNSSSTPSFLLAELVDPSIFFMSSSSLSTLEEASSILNWDSMDPAEDPGSALPSKLPISALTSAAASRASTLSSIRWKASMEVFPVMPPSMSLTCCVLCAVRARAIICSFFALLSRILASNACIPSYSLSTACACMSICVCKPSDVSICCWRRESASFASPSSPFCSANCARLYQSSPRASACSFCFIRRRCVAVISA
mmetsp:Transcript_6295/g.14529  ORF Transcript_6295/g.14529 Transcript_6295/m.14529 type:complete len:226 (-) Transcript_6295:386-1063(-)